MKGFQLANHNFPSADVAKSNRVHFHIHSNILSALKKYLPAILLLCGLHANAQNNTGTADTVYQKVIAERTAKIVTTLDVTDAGKRIKVQEIIAAQYISLNAIHDASKATVATIKAKQLSKEEIADAVKKEGDNKSEKLKQLHTQFIGQLKSTLTEAQIEKVKDGMTYRILPVTWTAYLDMLQKLTPEQKDKMYAWLVEARELAMDEGSSDAKHAVFGKYKGRINNYLSAAGYDMKKEGEDWAKRIQAAKDAKQNQN
jgi:Protein of unknown function (DUF3826)